MQASTKHILALDVGGKRTGVALASSQARLAMPYLTLNNSDHIFLELQKIVQTENVEAIVVGLPRGLEGQETAQTMKVKVFVERLKKAIVDIPLFWQDEAVTSVKAQAELNSRHRVSTKSDIDALAATYILEDFLKDNPKGTING
jgi:putative Holliday junction resolvase